MSDLLNLSCKVLTLHIMTGLKITNMYLRALLVCLVYVARQVIGYMA